MNRIAKFAAVAVAIVAVVGVTRSYGMSEGWSASSSRFVTGPSGTTGVPIGGHLEIGILGSNTVSGLQALQDNPLGLEAAFVDWGPGGSIGDGTGTAGSWDILTAGPLGAGFFSSQIYILTFNGATAGTSTQVGIWTNPSWIFPASDGAVAGIIDLGDSGIVAVIGTLSAGTVTTPSDLAGGDAAALHQVVPEPSSIALAAIGLIGLVGFARRRRS